MFKIDGKDYEVFYTKQRYRLVERTTGRSIISELNKSQGMLDLEFAETLLAYGLRKNGSDQWVDIDKALMLADKATDEGGIGLAGVVKLVSDSLSNDLGFLFVAPPTK